MKALIDLAHDRIGEPLATLLAKVAAGVFAEVAMATLALYTAGVPFPENVPLRLRARGVHVRARRLHATHEQVVRYLAIARDPILRSETR